MSNEYDYSGLYNNTSGSGQPNGQNPQPEQSAPAQNQQPQQSSYPNVGSSGVNTANTARTDYSSYNSGSTSGQNPQQDSNGYTSSFSGGNGNNGGYNGYSYSSAPQQPPVPQKKKGSKVLLRVLACVGVAALGFGGGLRRLCGGRLGRFLCAAGQQGNQQQRRQGKCDQLFHWDLLHRAQFAPGRPLPPRSRVIRIFMRSARRSQPWCGQRRAPGHRRSRRGRGSGSRR